MYFLCAEDESLTFLSAVLQNQSVYLIILTNVNREIVKVLLNNFVQITFSNVLQT